VGELCARAVDDRGRERVRDRRERVEVGVEGCAELVDGPERRRRDAGPRKPPLERLGVGQLLGRGAETA
jgi:hypothetical protein